MLTLATLALVGVNLWAGLEIGLGARRPIAVRVLRWGCPVGATLLLWQLAPLCSNTNDQGGDITHQLAMQFLAGLQLPLFLVVAGAGEVIRVVVKAISSSHRHAGA